MIFMDVFSYLLLLFALIDHFSHFPWERSEKKIQASLALHGTSAASMARAAWSRCPRGPWGPWRWPS